MTPSQGQVSILNSFVSLFIFYILSYLISKRMGCLSGCLVSSASIQKSFCRICSALKWPLDEFVGEKVVSLSSPFTILGPPPCCHIFITSLQFLSDLNIGLGKFFGGGGLQLRIIYIALRLSSVSHLLWLWRPHRMAHGSCWVMTENSIRTFLHFLRSHCYRLVF